MQIKQLGTPLLVQHGLELRWEIPGQDVDHSSPSASIQASV
jgi:hypothetical protein